MAPDCFACAGEECAQCVRCGRGFCWNHGGDAANPHFPCTLGSHRLFASRLVCTDCWHELASFQAIVPGLFLGLTLMGLAFAIAT